MTNTQRTAGHFALGLFNGGILYLGTDGQINLLLLALVSLVLLPAITLGAAHFLRIAERRQLEDTYNRPAHGEDQ